MAFGTARGDGAGRDPTESRPMQTRPAALIIEILTCAVEANVGRVQDLDIDSPSATLSVPDTGAKTGCVIGRVPATDCLGNARNRRGNGRLGAAATRFDQGEPGALVRRDRSSIRLFVLA